MARETLDDALKLTFGDEGGYSNARTDAGNFLGGELVGTKYGITGKTLAAHRGVGIVTAQDVRNMQLSEAADIYRAGYWTQSGGDILPTGLDYAVFDSGVLSGPTKAVRMLQEVIGAKVDGNAGTETLDKVRSYPGGTSQLIRDYCDARMAFLQSIKNPKTGFPKNGRGWTIRVTGKDPAGQWPDKPGVVGNALRLAGGVSVHPSAPESPPVPAGGDAKAVPPAPNPWVKPEVLGPVGAVLPGAAALVAGPGPLQWAFAFGVVVLILLGAFYAFRRIQKTPT